MKNKLLEKEINSCIKGTYEFCNFQSANETYTKAKEIFDSILNKQIEACVNECRIGIEEAKLNGQFFCRVFSNENLPKNIQKTVLKELRKLLRAENYKVSFIVENTTGEDSKFFNYTMKVSWKKLTK